MMSFQSRARGSQRCALFSVPGQSSVTRSVLVFSNVHPAGVCEASNASQGVQNSSTSQLAVP